MVDLKFPDPHEAETIPGTEGWERMYPYHYRFTTDDPERTKYEKGMFWFYDGLHYPEAMYPFDIIWDEAWYLALSQYNNRIFIVPPAMGIDHRIVNGYIYITPLPVSNPDDIPKRAEVFMKRAGYYYEYRVDVLSLRHSIVSLIPYALYFLSVSAVERASSSTDVVNTVYRSFPKAITTLKNSATSPNPGRYHCIDQCKLQ